MRNYQSVLILKPDLEDPQVDQAVEKITALIEKGEGEILKLDKWGKKRLAYRIKKHKFGIYLNIYHKLAAHFVDQLEKEYKLYDQVIKFLVIRLTEQELERVMNAPEETDAEKPEDGQAKEGADSKPKVEEVESTTPAEKVEPAPPVENQT